MLKINTPAITGLRDRLLEKGGAPSIIAHGPIDVESHPLAGDEEAVQFFDATFEAMYVMIASDGVVEQEEKDVLRGAIRELTAGVVRTAHIEKMMDDCQARSKKDGADARLKACAEVLKKDKMAAEAAFVLSAVMAFADDEIADEENETLNEFADLLDLDGDRANELLDELEAQQES